MKHYPYNIKPGSVLHRIGFLATVWWAVSYLYVLLVVLAVHIFEGGRGLREAFQSYIFLYWLLFIILVGWLILAAIWLKELKKAKVPYRTALKDLFLTIRK